MPTPAKEKRVSILPDNDNMMKQFLFTIFALHYLVYGSGEGLSLGGNILTARQRSQRNSDRKRLGEKLRYHASDARHRLARRAAHTETLALSDNDIDIGRISIQSKLIASKQLRECCQELQDRPYQLEALNEVEIELSEDDKKSWAGWSVCDIQDHSAEVMFGVYVLLMSRLQELTMRKGDYDSLIQRAAELYGPLTALVREDGPDDSNSFVLSNNIPIVTDRVKAELMDEIKAVISTWRRLELSDPKIHSISEGSSVDEETGPRDSSSVFNSIEIASSMDRSNKISNAFREASLAIAELPDGTDPVFRRKLHSVVETVFYRGIQGVDIDDDEDEDEDDGYFPSFPLFKIFVDEITNLPAGTNVNVRDKLLELMRIVFIWKARQSRIDTPSSGRGNAGDEHSLMSSNYTPIFRRDHW